MITDPIFSLLLVAAAGGGLYLIFSLIRVGERLSALVARLEGARLKALAKGNLDEAEQLGHILSLLSLGDGDGT